MDWLTLAGIYTITWIAALSTMGLTGVGKWIWHMISTSTEEAVVEKKTLSELEREGKPKA